MFSKKNKSDFLPCAIINNPETSSLSVSKVSSSYLDFFRRLLFTSTKLRLFAVEKNVFYMFSMKNHFTNTE
jgi:hypothetical protein